MGTSAEVIIELIGWNLNFSDSSSKEFLKKMKLNYKILKNKQTLKYDMFKVVHAILRLTTSFF